MARTRRRSLVLAVLGCLLLAGCADSLENRVKTAVSKGCRWLASQQRPNGGIYLSGDKLSPDVWETANSLIALMQCGSSVDRATIDKGFDFLDAHWTREGGLPEGTGRNAGPFKGYCVETTSTALRAYAAAGRYAQAERLRDFLLSVQEPEGAWKIGYPETKIWPRGEILAIYPSVTGFALAGLSAAPVERPEIARGLDWLAARQKPEGDWGFFSDYFWTPYYATAPIVSAYSAWGRRGDPVVERAARFTREHQNADGSWGDAGVPGTPSRELWTALALLTLEAAGGSAGQDAIRRGTTYLLNRQQPDGSWIGGFFKTELVDDAKKKEDVYATSLIIVALQQSAPASRP